eukprot:gene12901-3639_t
MVKRGNAAVAEAERTSKRKRDEAAAKAVQLAAGSIAKSTLPPTVSSTTRTELLMTALTSAASLAIGTAGTADSTKVQGPPPLPNSLLDSPGPSRASAAGMAGAAVVSRNAAAAAAAAATAAAGPAVNDGVGVHSYTVSVATSASANRMAAGAGGEGGGGLPLNVGGTSTGIVQPGTQSKRPLSAYTCFVAEHVARTIRENAGVDATGVAALLEAKWSAASQETIQQYEHIASSTPNVGVATKGPPPLDNGNE